MDKGLWLSNTEFISLSALEEKKQSGLLGELYSSSALDGFDPVSFLGLLPDPDPVLRKTGDGVEVLRSLTADDKVISSIQNRKLGTLKKKDFLFEAGKKEDDADPDNASKELCRRLTDDIDNIDLYYVFSQVLDAPYYGQTPVELIWEAVDGQLHLADLKPRPVEWFGYNSKHEPVFSGDLLNNPVIPEKMVISRHFPDATNPYGLRLLSRCLWPVAIKKGGIRFWTVLCERFGMPWVIGKVKGDKTNRQQALAQLTSMVQNAVAVLSQGAEVDVHTLTGKGGDIHQALVRHCDTAIARVLQGQNLTNEGGQTGSYAESQTSKENLTDFQEADEHLLVTFMNDLGKIYRDVNDPEARAPAFRYREPEDYIVLADLDTKLHGIGVRFNKSHFKKYRLSEDEFELESGRENNPDPNKSAGFSLSTGSQSDQITENQAVIDRFAVDLANRSMSDTQAAQKTILNVIFASNDYDEAMTRLLAVYPDISMAKIEEIMEQGLLNASLFGVWAQGREAEDG